MGNSIKSCLKSNFNKPLKIFLIGLHGAGKTTIMYRMKLAEYIQSLPTLGFNLEVFQSHGVEFEVWDVGLRSKRPLLHHVLPGMDVIIYVIDSNSRERIEEARDDLKDVLSFNDGRKIPVLILANKQDLPDHMTLQEIVEGLELDTEKHQRHLAVLPTCATSGEGLEVAFHWVKDVVISQSKGKHIFGAVETSYKISVKEKSNWTYRHLVSSVAAYAKSWLWENSGQSG